MIVKILINLVGLGKGLSADQITEIPDDVAAEWCRIGYASPVSQAVPEKATSKITPEVRDATTRIVSGDVTANAGTSQPGRSKKPSKD
jgi:hypothetical protein